MQKNCQNTIFGSSRISFHFLNSIFQGSRFSFQFLNSIFQGSGISFRFLNFCQECYYFQKLVEVVILGPLQKLLLPLIFGSNISLPLNNLLYSMNQQQTVEKFKFKGAEITVSLVLAKKLYCNAILAIESFLNQNFLTI